MMHYDESYKSIIEAVQTQLKFRVRIPADFSTYAIKIIEKWWREGYKWNGGSLDFSDNPTPDQMKNYEWLRT